jgi:hypothetical protein
MESTEMNHPGCSTKQTYDFGLDVVQDGIELLNGGGNPRLHGNSGRGGVALAILPCSFESFGCGDYLCSQAISKFEPNLTRLIESSDSSPLTTSLTTFGSLSIGRRLAISKGTCRRLAVDTKVESLQTGAVSLACWRT